MSKKDERAKPKYETPTVVALGGLARGAGVATCDVGSSADTTCTANGGAALTTCTSNGSLAGVTCTAVGSAGF
jgi:hypothetical protein